MTTLAKAISMADVIPSRDDRFTALVEIPARFRFAGPLMATTDPAKVPPLIATAFRDCRMGKAPWPLFIHGGVGCGKSRFAVVAHFYYGGLSYEFTELVSDYRQCKMGELRNEFYENRPVVTERMFRAKLESARLLIVDDIGAVAKDSPHERETLILALNARAAGKPAVFISNLSLAELAEVYDDRVSSRMTEGTVCNVKNGTDLRVKRCEVRQ